VGFKGKVGNLMGDWSGEMAITAPYCVVGWQEHTSKNVFMG